MNTYYLDASSHHACWDNALAPRLRIEPGDTVIFETRDVAAGQIGPRSVSADVRSLRLGPVRPLTGPVFVGGARPGDLLDIEVLDIRHQGWGWSAVRPGSGLLGTDFSDPYLHHFRLRGNTCWFEPSIGIPFEPSCGVLGVAPAAAGRFDTPPGGARPAGLDARLLVPGARLRLPVQTRGALFSCAAGRAVQRRGELDGAGIEAPMSLTLRFGLARGRCAPRASIESPAHAALPYPTGDRISASSHGPDLYANARDAVRYLVDRLVRTYRLSAEAAYCLCIAAADLEIREGAGAAPAATASLPVAFFRKRAAA